MVVVVKHLNERQVLVLDDAGEHYVVSESAAEASQYIGGKEVLVFPALTNGRIADYSEVDGERGVGLEEFLPKLLKRGTVGWGR